MHHTVEIRTWQDEQRPFIWHAESVSGPRCVRGYTLWHTDADSAASGVERAIRAVFPQHSFDFTRTPV